MTRTRIVIPRFEFSIDIVDGDTSCGIWTAVSVEDALDAVRFKLGINIIFFPVIIGILSNYWRIDKAFFCIEGIILCENP